MSFEKIYEKYTLGTATEEEKKFVEEEIAKARKLSEIIDGKETDGAILADADVATIKKARKRHSVKFALKALAISLAVAVTAVGAVCGGVFGTAMSFAKKNAKISLSDAEKTALAYYAKNYTHSAAKGEPFIKDSEKDVEFTKPLKNSLYSYKVGIDQPGGYEIEFEIDSRTGEIKVIDWD